MEAIKVDAVIFGILSSAFFFLCIMLVAFFLKRFGISNKMKVVILLLLGVVFIFMVPPPGFVVVSSKYVEVANPGHAGYRFMGPYISGSILSVVAALYFSRRK